MQCLAGEANLLQIVPEGHRMFHEFIGMKNNRNPMPGVMKVEMGEPRRIKDDDMPGKHFENKTQFLHDEMTSLPIS